MFVVVTMVNVLKIVIWKALSKTYHRIIVM